MSGPRFTLRRGRLFLDDPAVIAAMDKAERKPLMRMGAFVRSDARRSMRPARRKREGELTDAERQKWDRIQRARKRRGKPAGKIPFYVHSRPGEPPKTIKGDIKRLLFFVWDQQTRAVVVGPEGFPGTDAPEDLEHGGTVTTRDGTRAAIAPRPFMFPALQTNAPKFPQLFANALR